MPLCRNRGGLPPAVLPRVGTMPAACCPCRARHARKAYSHAARTSRQRRRVQRRTSSAVKQRTLALALPRASVVEVARQRRDSMRANGYSSRYY